MKIYRLRDLPIAIKGRTNCKVAFYCSRDKFNSARDKYPEIYEEIKLRKIEIVLVNTRPKPEEI